MPDLDYVKVVGRLGIVVRDEAADDPDLEPDTVWCDSGSVIFTPLVSAVKVVGALPVPATLGQSAIVAEIDADGYLSLRGNKEIHLVDLGSTKVNPFIPAGKATHKVEFVDVTADGIPVSFPTPVNARFSADTAIGGQVDITLVTPVPVSGGTAQVIGRDGVSVLSMSIVDNELVYLLSDDTSGSAGELPVLASNEAYMTAAQAAAAAAAASEAAADADAAAALSSKNAAATSATNAATSETNANASKVAAQGSASSASASATTASASATSAAASASTAATAASLSETYRDQAADIVIPGSDFVVASLIADTASDTNESIHVNFDPLFVTRAEYTGGGGGISPTIYDAKGDLVVGLANDTPNRVAVGTNGQALVADSNATQGVAWRSRPLLYSNLLTNPSVETNTSSVTAIGTGSVVSRNTSEFYSGTASAQVVCDGSTAGQGIQFANGGTVSAGNYVGAVWVKAPAGAPLTIALTGGGLGTLTKPFAGTGSWQRVETPVDAATSAGAKGVIVRTTSATAVTFYADAAMLVSGPDMPDYFDGDTAGCYWLGVAHASTSVRSASSSETLSRSSLPVLARNLIVNPSFEFGTTGWAVFNSAISLARGTVPYAGAAHMGFTAGVGVADSGVEMTSRVRVTAGTIYTASGYTYAGSSGTSILWQITWYDEAGTLLSITSSTHVLQGPIFQRVFVTGTAPNGAATAGLRYLRTGTTSANTLRLDAAQFEVGSRATEYVDGDQKGCYWLGTPHASESIRIARASDGVSKSELPELARNYLLNPSVETNTNAISVVTGASSIARTTVESYLGGASLLVTTTGAGISEGAQFLSTNTAQTVTALPAGYYAGGAWVKAPVGATLTIQVRLGNGGGVLDSVVSFTGIGAWQWVSTGSAYSSVVNDARLRVFTSGTAQAITFYVDSAVLTQSMGPIPASSYFDGDTQGCYWLGVPHNSASAKYALPRAETVLDRDISGTGFPEGLYAARVGTTYTDTNATNGAVAWIKLSGTGNTGWRVQHGDTGWRSVTLLNGWTGNLYIRRVNDRVNVHVIGLNGSAATSDTFYTLPAGFQVTSGRQTQWFGNLTDTTGTTAENFGITKQSTGNLDARYTGASTRATVNLWGDFVVYADDAAWPATLPGVAG